MKRPAKLRAIFMLWLLPALFFLDGCAWLIAPPESDSKASQHLADWTGRNAGLKQFKGMLRVQIKTEGQTLNGRAALAGIVPNRLRVELLHSLGQPITSLAGDGTTIRVHAVSEGRFYQWNQNGSALERFIHVPLGIEALLEILSGRPPLPAYAAAQMAAEAEAGCDIVLKDRWNHVVASLQCGDGGRIRMFQAFDIEGGLQYEVSWDAWQEVSGYLLPHTVRMTSGRGDQVTWSLERFWPDVQIAPATFVLEGSDHS